MKERKHETAKNGNAKAANPGPTKANLEPSHVNLAIQGLLFEGDPHVDAMDNDKGRPACYHDGRNYTEARWRNAWGSGLSGFSGVCG